MSCVCVTIWSETVYVCCYCYVRSLLVVYLYSYISSISIEKIKQLPLPIPPEDTSIVPPFCYISDLHMFSPRPIPWEFIFAVLYSLPNIEKSLGRSSCIIPTPVSLTSTQRRLFSLSYQLSTSILPLGVNFSAFYIKLIRTYWKRV